MRFLRIPRMEVCLHSAIAATSFRTSAEELIMSVDEHLYRSILLQYEDRVAPPSGTGTTLTTRRL